MRSPSDDPVAEAVRIADEDAVVNRAIGASGLAVVPDRCTRAHALQRGGTCVCEYGTAVGVIRAAHEAGRAPSVWVDETRPVRQGARLTAWELDRLGIPCTVVVDGLAAALMAGGEVDLVVVGADRIAANGDVANKVGTYGRRGRGTAPRHPVLRRGTSFDVRSLVPVG